jgi:hypothetical protein
MPGKYPLITAPSRTRTSLAAGGSPGLSESSTETLKAMFPNSPIYKSTSGGAQTDAQYRTYAASYLQPDTQQGDPDQLPYVNLNYTGPTSGPMGIPDPATQAPSFEGLTSDQYEGRYLPYLVVPTDPSAGIDGTSSGTERLPNDNFGSGNDVTVVRPDVTAPLIAATTIDVTGPIAPKGQSGTGAAGTETTTHLANPGAYTTPTGP